MRAIAPVALLPLLALAAGCTSAEPSDFGFRTDFSKQTRGLILHEDGEAGHAGMYGTNCPFETFNGGVTGDYDLPEEGEDIQDGEETELGEITIAAVIPGTVHVLDKTDGLYTHVPVSVPGVTEARLVFDGVVALTEVGGECELRWFELDGHVRRNEPLASCDGVGVEVDPGAGVALVAGVDGVVVFPDRGRVEVALQGDLVAWDDVLGVFYVARRGATGLSAVGADGSVQWTIPTAAPVGAIDDAGATGAVAAVLALPSGRGLLQLFDGQTGELLKAGETPSPAEDLSVSGDGTVLALVRPEQSFFFDIL
jgi:hypothetical protein